MLSAYRVPGTGDCLNQFQTFMELAAVRRQTTTKRSSKNTSIDALKTGFWEDLPEETAIKPPWRETLTPKQTGRIRDQKVDRIHQD